MKILWIKCRYLSNTRPQSQNQNPAFFVKVPTEYRTKLQNVLWPTISPANMYVCMIACPGILYYSDVKPWVCSSACVLRGPLFAQQNRFSIGHLCMKSLHRWQHFIITLSHFCLKAMNKIWWNNQYTFYFTITRAKNFKIKKSRFLSIFSLSSRSSLFKLCKKYLRKWAIYPS